MVVRYGLSQPLCQKFNFLDVEADPPRNDYTFMHGELLFQISITHFDGTEDPALGNQFLSSITFHSP